MKAVLLRPPDPMGMVDVLAHVLPTNIGYIAAYIRQHGFEVEIWDYEQEPFDARQFLRRVEEAAPRVIGISCMTPTITNGNAIATLVKRHFPHIVTVVGGAHSSALPAETLQEFENFDVIVTQEGELTFLELCQRIEEKETLSGVQGIVWRDGDRIVSEQARELLDNLDDFPFPARDLYHRPKLAHGHSTRGFSNALHTTEIFTSRGCPYKCTFCAIVATFGRSVRWRSPENVFEEVAHVQKRYNVDHVIIADDTFGLYPGRIEALCEGFSRLGLKSWSCDTRVDCVNPDKLKRMKASGCTKVAFGVETGSERIVRLNQKKIKFADVHNAIRWSREAGIRQVEANFIVGSHPEETLEDLELTAKLIKQLPLTFISISVIVPYPGTPNYDYMDQRELIFSKDWSKYVMFGQTPCWRTVHFTSEDLIRHQRRLNRIFYLDPGFLFRTLCGIRSLRDLIYYMKAGKAFMRWVLGGSVAPNPQVVDAGEAKTLTPAPVA